MNWIKIRTNLAQDTDVGRLSDILGTNDSTSVGLLVIFWSWVDGQTADGTGIATTSARIDRLVGHDGFAEGMRQIGWLSGRDGALCLPHFERHNGNSAKARALEAEAKRLRRDGKSPPKMSDNMSDMCPTKSAQNVRPEKRREEKKEVSKLSSAHEIPSLDEVKRYAKASPLMISEQCAIRFHDTQEGGGWLLNNGHPIVDWKAIFRVYASRWNENEKGRSSQGSPQPNAKPDTSKRPGNIIDEDQFDL